MKKTSRLAHLVAADVRRFRLVILVWIAVLVGGAILTVVMQLAPQRPGLSRALGLTGFLLGLAHVLLSVVLVPLVVQAHPLVGSDAFWMTRPIPPRTLLASKLALLSILLLAVPVVCDVALMAVFRVPAAEMGLVAAQSTLFRAFFAMALMSAAAITRSVARFTMLCGAVLLLLAIATTVAATIAMSGMDDARLVAVSVAPVATGSDATPVVLGIGLMILAGLAMVFVQYDTRSLRRSITVGVAGVLGGYLLASVWSLPLVYQRLHVPAWTQSSDALTLTVDTKTVGFEPVSGWSDESTRWRTARATMWLDGVARDWVATARLASASLDLPGGSTLVSPNSYHSAALPPRDENVPPQRRTVRNVLAVRRVVESGPRRGENGIVFRMRAGDFERVKSQVGTYRGQFLIDLRSVEIAAILPIERDASYQDGAYRFRIDGVHQGSHGVTIRSQTSNVTMTMFDRRPRPYYSFYLRNRRVSEAAAGRRFEDDSFFPLMLAGFGRHGVGFAWSGFVTERNLLGFPEGHGSQEESMDITIDWLADAELVIVRTTSEGAVPRRLEFEGFPLSERRFSNDPQTSGVTLAK